MSALSTRTVTEAEARVLLQQFYLARQAEVLSADRENLQELMNMHMSGCYEWEFENFSVAP